MKILAFTDIHADPFSFKKLKEKVKEGKPDLIVCCGDLSNFGMDLNYGVKQLLSFGIKTLLIPGNHESVGEIKEISEKHPSLMNLHDHFFVFNEFVFYGYGGGGFSFREEAFERILPKTLKKIPQGKKLVFVTHAPIYGTKLDLLPLGHRGCKSTRMFVEKAKPVLVLCGHFHENERKQDKINNSKILNPGHEGMLIEI